MSASTKLALIDRVGRELQSRYTLQDLEAFLNHYGIPGAPPVFGSYSKLTLAKARLAQALPETILAVAADLGVDPVAGQPAPLPAIWRGTGALRVFISHLAKDKDKALRLKECLGPRLISGFVAHEDITPTAGWQAEIERALRALDAFVALITAGFARSCWTQQEVGFAVGRGVKVISLKMGDEDPTGFISREQALPRRGRPADAIAAEIEGILAADDRTAAKLKDAIPF